MFLVRRGGAPNHLSDETREILDALLDIIVYEYQNICPHCRCAGQLYVKWGDGTPYGFKCGRCQTTVVIGF